jgi:hypothetical protein
MILLADGSLAIATGPNGGTTGAVLRFTDSNGDGVADGPGTAIYQTATGPLTGFQPIGKYFVLGNYGGHTITLLAPGATPDAQLTPAGTLQFSYPRPYEHDTIESPYGRHAEQADPSIWSSTSAPQPMISQQLSRSNSVG